MDFPKVGHSVKENLLKTKVRVRRPLTGPVVFQKVFRPNTELEKRRPIGTYST